MSLTLVFQLGRPWGVAMEDLGLGSLVNLDLKLTLAAFFLLEFEQAPFPWICPLQNGQRNTCLGAIMLERWNKTGSMKGPALSAWWVLLNISPSRGPLFREKPHVVREHVSIHPSEYHQEHAASFFVLDYMESCSNRSFFKSFPLISHRPQPSFLGLYWRLTFCWRYSQARTLLSFLGSGLNDAAAGFLESE